jgi:hypothetical protein
LSIWSEIGEQLSLFEANRDAIDRSRVGADRWIAHIEGDPDALLEARGDLMVAVGLGFAMLKLAGPDRVPGRLLGAANFVLLGAVESGANARAALAGASPASAGAPRDAVGWAPS